MRYITRVGELRKQLASFADNDFIYIQCDGDTKTLFAASEFVNGECTLKPFDIIEVPLTNQLIQDYIKDYEQ